MKPKVQALLQKAHDSLQAADLSFSSHSAVIAAFGKEFARSGALDPKFHRYLIDAQDSRQAGDYGVGPAVSAAQAQKILDWTREFIATAERFLSSC